jgi:hypothetical protein
VGQTRHSSWLLSTDCSSQPCILHLIGETRDGSKIDGTGPFRGRSVKGSATAGLRCFNSATSQTLFEFDQTHGSFTIHVTNLSRDASVPQATAFKGSISFAWAPPAGQSIAGCGATSETDSVTGTLRPVPLPEPLPSGAPTPPVSDAAVVGSWATTLHVETAKGIEGKKVGDDVGRLFEFLPKCANGSSCGVTLIRESSDGITRNELSAKGGGTYSEVQHSTVTCGSGKADFSQMITLHVRGAQLIGGVWRATTLSGALTIGITPQAGAQGCARSFERDGISGDLQR